MNTPIPNTKVSDKSHPAGAVRLNRMTYFVVRHWLLIFVLAMGLYIGLPWLAPVFMKIGWTGAGNAIYAFYSTQCHQLPQRSFFLFGSKPMYSLSEVQAAWQPTANPMVLRQFVGNDLMGWKVAWSDRMVSLFTGVWAGMILMRLLGKRVKTLPFKYFILLTLPIVLDGVSHMLSDLAGIGVGFRDSNAWLATITNNVLSHAFYAGDALGSFNSWMRLLTGALFGIGVAWLGFPYIEKGFSDMAREMEEKFRRAGLPL